MRVAQVVSSAAVTAALASGVVFVAHLRHGTAPGQAPGAAPPAPVSATSSGSDSTPAFRNKVAAAPARRSSRSAPARTASRAARGATAPRAATPTARRPSPPAPRRPATSAPAPGSRRPTQRRSSSAAATQPRRTPAAARRGGRLPLPYSTGSATEVLTVVSGSASSATATVQAWQRAPGGGWDRRGAAVAAHVGADGMSNSPSESRSATPIGSFTLTQAFGRDADPGTGLPYLRTTPSDWWISQAGPLYNTHQRCSSRCGFSPGSPNEHLYYETPYYDYAVVIDYNTRNAPGGVRPGAGSAFFLHVTDGAPTAGCVAIPRDQLLSIMRWLRSAAHPRILIGTS